jgi:outer membrane protein assembly factor BamB
MMRSLLILIAGLVAPTLALGQISRPQLIDQTAANQHGLKRAWFAQVHAAGGRAAIVDIRFDGGTLFVQSGIGSTQAIDGKTGRTLWDAHVGSPDQPFLPLGIGETRVAVINGTTLYILDRGTGQVQFTTRLRGVPSVGAALSEEAVFVPTMSAQVEAYSLLHDDHRSLGTLRLEGRGLTQPAVSQIGVGVGSDRGDFGMGSLSGANLIFRTSTNYPIVAAPSAWGPRLFVGNVGGLAYLFADVSGHEKWSFAAGQPITQPPVPFADAVYLLCEDLTMFRVSAETGREEWAAAGVKNFLAASPTKLYTIDRFGRLAVLNAKNGALIDRVGLPPIAFPVTNNDSDQIFLANDRGLIQSLHEIELTERLDYRAPKKPAPPVDAPAAANSQAAPGPATPAPAPPAAEPPPAAAPLDANPFGPPGDIPPADANPFGAPMRNQ